MGLPTSCSAACCIDGEGTTWLRARIPEKVAESVRDHRSALINLIRKIVGTSVGRENPPTLMGTSAYPPAIRAPMTKIALLKSAVLMRFRQFFIVFIRFFAFFISEEYVFVVIVARCAHIIGEANTVVPYKVSSLKCFFA